MFFQKSKGQSTLEYVMMISFVVAALIYLGLYVNRAMQGKMRDSADQIGEQYDIRKTTSSYTTISNSVQTETSNAKGRSTINIQVNTQNKTGGETVDVWTDKDWDGSTYRGGK